MENKEFDVEEFIIEQSFKEDGITYGEALVLEINILDYDKYEETGEIEPIEQFKPYVKKNGEEWVVSEELIKKINESEKYDFKSLDTVSYGICLTVVLKDKYVKENTKEMISDIIYSTEVYYDEETETEEFTWKFDTFYCNEVLDRAYLKYNDYIIEYFEDKGWEASEEDDVCGNYKQTKFTRKKPKQDTEIEE